MIVVRNMSLSHGMGLSYDIMLWYYDMIFYYKAAGLDPGQVFGIKCYYDDQHNIEGNSLTETRNLVV